MSANSKRESGEAQLRKLIDDRSESVRSKDVNAAMSDYSPEVRMFDVVTSLEMVGVDACRKRTEEWFSSFKGPIGYEIHDLSITSGADAAFSHSLNRVIAKRTDGSKLEMWWRATVCYRKIDGKWLITHEHNSVPFDRASGKALLDLEP
jgi:ketosteroid isomerase-like protein